MSLRSSVLFSLISAIIALVLILTFDPGCRAPTPEEARAGTKAACALVTAYADTPEADTICATAPELAELIMRVAADRVDAGPARKLGACRPVADSGFCATDREISAGIAAIRAARAARRAQ